MSHAHESEQSARASAIHELVDAAFAVRGAPSPETLDALCRCHPELMPELAQRLTEARQIREARLLARDTNAPGGHWMDPRTESEPRARPADPGRSSARYASEGEIARGGMGRILKVWDRNLERHLAMKVLLGDPASETRAEPAAGVDVRDRFSREALVTSQLDHPGIVPVHEFGLDSEGRPYFTMKLVKGRDLSEVFADVFRGVGEVTETGALAILLKVCDAVAYAHSKGVVHRDLKPANVRVGDFGEVYVMDWGLARVAQASDASPAAESDGAPDEPERASHAAGSGFTRAGSVIGTPAYMSPEQAHGERHLVSPRSDVYAIGAMLYHLLARRAPYHDTERATDAVILARVLLGPPPALRSLRSDVAPELEAICSRAMAREPEARYGTTTELAEDLRAYLEGRVVRAHATGPWIELRKWIGRNRGLSLALAGAGLAGVAGIVVTVMLLTSLDQKRTLEAQNRTIETQRDQVLAALSEVRVRDEVLTASRDLALLVERAPDLWPPLPERLEALTAWIAEASALVEGRPADPQLGIAARPGLADYRTILAHVVARARPPTAVELEADQRSNPYFAEWRSVTEEALWIRRMLGSEAWPTEAQVEARMDAGWRSLDANDLADQAARYLHPDPRFEVHGHEVEALLLAREALAKAPDRERAWMLHLHAMALYRRGRLDDAVAEARLAVKESDALAGAELERKAQAIEDLAHLWREEAPRFFKLQKARRLDQRAAALEPQARRRIKYAFDDPNDLNLYDVTLRLVTGLEALADPRTGLLSDGISPQHGWGIRKRLEFAHTIEQRSVLAPDARALWARARAEIADDARYGSLDLVPQVGLLPLGRDPRSKLQEFAHLASGEPAQRDSNGNLSLSESTGLVLVLIPRTTARIGAQSTDPKDAGFDPLATSDEKPVRERTIESFFLSKYEMTQGQWLRCAGSNPSLRLVSGTDPHFPCVLLNPVEQVGWNDCFRVLGRFGLVMPGEWQWEAAARAGTTTPWWMGELESVSEQANVRGALARAATPDGRVEAPGHVCVGMYPANGFGLHDVVGNVAEWCADAYSAYDRPLPNVAPHSAIDTDVDRAVRGGHFRDAPANARSAYRARAAPDFRSDALGVRPARDIDR